MIRKFVAFFILIIINSCSYPEMSRNELIYENDFENKNLTSIDGGGLSQFNNSTVLGDYNNDGFTIHLENVGQLLNFNNLKTANSNFKKIG